jgi:hypothetical protein
MIGTGGGESAKKYTERHCESPCMTWRRFNRLNKSLRETDQDGYLIHFKDVGGPAASCLSLAAS